MQKFNKPSVLHSRARRYFYALKGGDEMKIEVRSAGEVVISGYVNAVDRDSRCLPPSMCSEATKPFYERIRPGTFAAALKKNDNIELRFNHRRILGSTKDGALELHEDGVGLWARAVIRDAEVADKAGRGELRGWSFGFFGKRDTWEEVNPNTSRRNLEEIDLREVSILDKTPAYIGTSVASVEFRGEESEVLELRSGVDPEGEAPEKKRPWEFYKHEAEILAL